MNVKRAQGSFGISLGARSAVIWSSTESVELLPLQCRNQDEFSSHSRFPQPFSQMLRSLPSRCNAEAIASSNRAPLHTTVRTGSVHGGSRSCVVTPRQACGIGNTDRSRFWVREEHHSISGQTLFPKSHPMIQTSIEATETETRN